MLKWTHSNAVTLEKIGHDAAVAFAEARQSNNKEEFDQKYRYYNYVKQKDRFNDFLRPFTHLFSGEASWAGQSGGDD